jgi:hypothetical protein
LANSSLFPPQGRRTLFRSPQPRKLGLRAPRCHAGLFTNFAAGTSQVSFGAGVTVNSVSVTSSTNLTAQITVLATAALGPRTVTVTTGIQVVSFANGFTVQPGTPVLLTAAPSSAQQGQQNYLASAD